MPAVNCEFLNRPKSLMKDLPISTVCFVSKIQYPCTWLMNIDYRHSNWHNKIMVGGYLMVFQITHAINLLLRKIELCSFISDSAVILAIAVSKRCTRDLPVVNAQNFVYLPFGHSRKKFSKPSFSLLTLGYHFRSTSFLLFGRVKRVARAWYRPPPPPLRPPLSSLLSRASRASTFHDIPQRESLLAG